EEAKRQRGGGMVVGNLYSQVPSGLAAERFEALLTAANVRIERIISHGHASPPDFWYDQAEGEWILLLQGAARLQLDGETLELRPGDCLNLPPHTRHRVDWTTPDEPTIWLAVF